LKNSLIHILIISLCILAISCISYNSAIHTYKFKSSVEVYPIDVIPIEVYPIEAYLIGKSVVEVSVLTHIWQGMPAYSGPQGDNRMRPVGRQPSGGRDHGYSGQVWTAG
jgi:hypothetical protein